MGHVSLLDSWLVLLLALSCVLSVCSYLLVPSACSYITLRLLRLSWLLARTRIPYPNLNLNPNVSGSSCLGSWVLARLGSCLAFLCLKARGPGQIWSWDCVSALAWLFFCLSLARKNAKPSPILVLGLGSWLVLLLTRIPYPNLNLNPNVSGFFLSCVGRTWRPRRHSRVSGFNFVRLSKVLS